METRVQYSWGVQASRKSDNSSFLLGRYYNHATAGVFMWMLFETREQARAYVAGRKNPDQLGYRYRVVRLCIAVNIIKS